MRCLYLLALAASFGMVGRAWSEPIALPDRIHAANGITFCSDLNTSPSQYVNPTTFQPDGAAVDMLYAVGAALGVPAHITNVAFAGIFPALDTNKCDAIMSSTSKTPQRLEKYDFVNYWAVGSGILVKRSGGFLPRTFQDLGGHHVSVLLGSRNQQRLMETNLELAKTGAPQIDIESFPAATVAFQQLDLGRVDAMVNDTIVLAYFVNLSHDKFTVSGAPVPPTTFGIIVPKTSAGVAAALQAAVDQLTRNGQLEAITDKWGVSDGVTLCRTRTDCP